MAAVGGNMDAIQEAMKTATEINIDEDENEEMMLIRTLRTENKGQKMLSLMLPGISFFECVFLLLLNSYFLTFLCWDRQGKCL